MSELSKLMLKAVRSLPPEEQDALLEAMLETRLAPWPAPGGAGLPALPSPDLLAAQGPHPIHGHDPRYGVTLPPLGPETGGPWQSVPVRLSTDQHERLKQWCQANGFTMAVVLRGLVARFLDDQATRRFPGARPGPPVDRPGPPVDRPGPPVDRPGPPVAQPGTPPSATEPPGGGA
jgi:hypothetical protein